MINVQVRRMVRRDLREVLDIENSIFEFPWDEEEFLAFLRGRNNIGMIAQDSDDRVVGYVLYSLFSDYLCLASMCVAKAAQRQGVGKQIIDTMINKLSQQRRRAILLEVRETNLDAQLFFRSQGFRAVEVLREHYEETSESAYLMRYSVNDRRGDVLSEFRNRITEHLKRPAENQ